MVRREALNWLKEAIADYRRAGRALEDGDWALAALCPDRPARNLLRLFI